MNKKIIFISLFPLIMQAMEAPFPQSQKSVRDYLLKNPDLIEGRTHRRTLDLSGLELTSLDGLEYVPGIQTITRLNLSNNNLTNIPNDSFRFMPQLKVLNLRHNNIKTIEPLGFNNLTQLEELDLTDNHLIRISIELRGLPALKLLDLQGNHIGSIHVNAFRDLINLEALDLGTNNLVYLDPNLFNRLKSLRFIDLTDNDGLTLSPQDKMTILKKIALGADIDTGQETDKSS